MAILDRPMFQRRMTKGQLRQYGLPAFANGGVVKMRNGGLPFLPNKPQDSSFSKILENRTNLPFRPNIKPETAITEVLEDRPTFPSTGLTIPTQVAEEEKNDFEIELKEKPTPPKDLGGKEGETKMTDERLLLERAKKKSDLYNEYLRKYGEDDFRTQSFLQLAQFGLNLMSQGGSNFLDKVAKSAQDPLKAFAEIAAKNTQAQKEIDVLALQKAETEIALEKEQQFELAKEAIKNSKTANATKVEQYADLLQTNFPDMYPNTKEGRQKAIAQGFTYVEESPAQPLEIRLADARQRILSGTEAFNYYNKDGTINLEKLNQDAMAIITGEQEQATPDASANVANTGEIITAEEFLQQES